MKYITVSDVSEYTYEEKKSEFIAVLKPVKTADEAVSFVNSVKAQHRKARHNVYAYIVREGNAVRYSDDGEPQGTAGVPVLEVLKKQGLSDVCVVVTRYFGGVLLGANGLVRAYSTACKGAVENAVLKLMEDAVEISLVFAYSLYGKISFALEAFDVKILSNDFSSDVSMRLLVKANRCDELCKKLVDITGGKISLVKSDTFEADFA